MPQYMVDKAKQKLLAVGLSACSLSQVIDTQLSAHIIVSLGWLLKALVWLLRGCRLSGQAGLLGRPGPAGW